MGWVGTFLLPTDAHTVYDNYAIYIYIHPRKFPARLHTVCYTTDLIVRDNVRTTTTATTTYLNVTSSTLSASGRAPLQSYYGRTPRT